MIDAKALDVLFRVARTQNSQPMRIVFVRSKAAKGKLAQAVRRSMQDRLGEFACSL
jgi:hypothetical protein